MTEERVAVGAWWDPAIWARARAAYLFDLDDLAEAPAGFINWLHWILEAHLRRVGEGETLELPRPRELAAKADPAHPERVAGLSRHHPLRIELVDAIDEALVAERRAQIYRTRSAWIQEAVVVAITDAERRAGGTLPPVPPGVRLPNQPVKSRR